MVTSLTESQRQELIAIHRSLARLHKRVNTITASVQRKESASVDDSMQTLDVQLSITDTMQLISKALYDN